MIDHRQWHLWYDILENKKTDVKKLTENIGSVYYCHKFDPFKCLVWRGLATPLVYLYLSVQTVIMKINLTSTRARFPVDGHWKRDGVKSLGWIKLVLKKISQSSKNWNQFSSEFSSLLNLSAFNNGTDLNFKMCHYYILLSMCKKLLVKLGIHFCFKGCQETS